MIFKINKDNFFSFEHQIFNSVENSLEPNTVLYHSPTNTIPVLYDIPLEVARRIIFFFKEIFSKKLTLPHWVSAFEVGRTNAIFLHDRWTNDNFQIEELFKYHLFSIYNVTVIVYNYDQKIIMEITPDYKWDIIDLDELPEGTVIPTFEQFMQSYKPIAIHEISQETAQEWIKQAQDYLSIVEPQFVQWCKEHRDELYVLKEDA